MDGLFNINVRTTYVNGWSKEKFCIRCTSKSQMSEWDGVSIRQKPATDIG
jgi:hypothetical protein